MPCSRCGKTDRWSSGKCRPCVAAARAARAHRPCTICSSLDKNPTGGCRPCGRRHRTARQTLPCRKCGTVDRNGCGQCRPCLKRSGLARSSRACVKCGAVDRFSNGNCRPCHLASRLVFGTKQEVRTWHTEYNRQRKYNLTPEEQRAMFIAQDGRCGCCGDPLEPGGKTALDHDHSTSQVRAFVCRGCNMAIGNVKDSPLRAHKLVAYLEKHQLKLTLIKGEKS